MQDNKRGFHKMEHVKLGNAMDTAKAELSKQMLSSGTGNRYSRGKGKWKGRRFRGTTPKNQPGCPRSGSEQTWVTRPRTGGRRKGPGERKRRTNPGSKVRTGKGSQRRGDGGDEPPGHGRAREQREPLWQRPRPARGLPSAGAAAPHSHLADELLPEVGAAPVGLGPGHVHPCGRRCRPRAPRRRCSSARRGGSTVSPLPARWRLVGNEVPTPAPPTLALASGSARGSLGNVVPPQAPAPQPRAPLRGWQARRTAGPSPAQGHGSAAGAPRAGGWPGDPGDSRPNRPPRFRPPLPRRAGASRARPWFPGRTWRRKPLAEAAALGRWLGRRRSGDRERRPPVRPPGAPGEAAPP